MLIHSDLSATFGIINHGIFKFLSFTYWSSSKPYKLFVYCFFLWGTSCQFPLHQPVLEITIHKLWHAALFNSKFSFQSSISKMLIWNLMHLLSDDSERVPRNCKKIFNSILSNVYFEKSYYCLNKNYCFKSLHFWVTLTKDAPLENIVIELITEGNHNPE